MRQTSRHGGTFEKKTIQQLAQEHVRNVVPHAKLKKHKVRQPHPHGKKPRHRKAAAEGKPQPMVEGS